jgi:hypothetical protein
MKSAQMGSATRAPCRPRESAPAGRIHPHTRDDGRIEANEPGVAIVVRRTGLPANAPCTPSLRADAPVPRSMTSLEHRQHLKCDLRREDLLALDVGAMHALPIGVLDVDDAARVNAIAERRKHRVRGCEIQRRHEAAAERKDGTSG